jgi:hypothetical protein
MLYRLRSPSNSFHFSPHPALSSTTRSLAESRYFFLTHAFGGVQVSLLRPGFLGKQYYSVITWSAHSINDTNIVGLPNFAP